MCFPFTMPSTEAPLPRLQGAGDGGGADRQARRGHGCAARLHAQERGLELGRVLRRSAGVPQGQEQDPRSREQEGGRVVVHAVALVSVSQK